MLKERRKLEGRIVIVMMSVVLFLMMGTAGVYADDNTFSSYSDAEQYIYQNVMEMNPEINYTLKLDSMSDFDSFSSSSISGLTSLDDGLNTAGDCAALN
ncbi:MAG: hypothetical protein LKH51_07275, partial [Eubacterium sp.]|nr:hypothetical protein [Eubacterium sp.]